jgi:hypothetical protein
MRFYIGYVPSSEIPHEKRHLSAPLCGGTGVGESMLMYCKPEGSSNENSGGTSS